MFDLTSLGEFSQQNGFIITQSLFAIIMLARKCYLLMNDFDPVKIAKSHLNKVSKHIKTDHLLPWIQVTNFQHQKRTDYQYHKHSGQ